MQCRHSFATRCYKFLESAHFTLLLAPNKTKISGKRTLQKLGFSSFIVLPASRSGICFKTKMKLNDQHVFSASRCTLGRFLVLLQLRMLLRASLQVLHVAALKSVQIWKSALVSLLNVCPIKSITALVELLEMLQLDMLWKQAIQHTTRQFWVFWHSRTEVSRAGCCICAQLRKNKYHVLKQQIIRLKVNHCGLSLSLAIGNHATWKSGRLCAVAWRFSG